MAEETIKIDLTMTAEDKTGPAFDQIQQKLSKFEMSMQKTMRQVQRMTKARLEMVIYALDSVTPILNSIVTRVKRVTDGIYFINFRASDLAASELGKSAIKAGNDAGKNFNIAFWQAFDSNKLNVNTSISHQETEQKMQQLNKQIVMVGGTNSSYATGSESGKSAPSTDEGGIDWMTWIGAAATVAGISYGHKKYSETKEKTKEVPILGDKGQVISTVRQKIDNSPFITKNSDIKNGEKRVSILGPNSEVLSTVTKTPTPAVKSLGWLKGTVGKANNIMQKGKFGKALVKEFTPVAIGLDFMNIATAKPGIERAQAIGSAAGGIIGGALGTAFGGFLGPGGMILGSWAGEKIGSLAGGGLYNLYKGTKDMKEPQQPVSQKISAGATTNVTPVQINLQSNPQYTIHTSAGSDEVIKAIKDNQKTIGDMLADEIAATLAKIHANMPCGSPKYAVGT